MALLTNALSYYKIFLTNAFVSNQHFARIDAFITKIARHKSAARAYLLNIHVHKYEKEVFEVSRERSKLDFHTACTSCVEEVKACVEEVKALLTRERIRTAPLLLASDPELFLCARGIGAGIICVHTGADSSGSN